MLQGWDTNVWTDMVWPAAKKSSAHLQLVKIPKKGVNYDE